MQERKKYVQVDVRFTLEGEMEPLRIYLESGRVCEIDKVLDSRRAASMKVGGQGIRYTVRIHGQSKHLWYEEPKWFVAARADG
jgi:hypothetical protein